MTVLQICAFGADYGGNFISSLETLEKILLKKGHNTIYAFSETAKDKEWCKKIQERTKVYFLPVARARILPKTYRVCKQLFTENNIEIVHSHFELYDIPVTITAPKHVGIYWHLHDAITSDIPFTRRLLNKIQYKIISENVALISVSEHYRKTIVEMGFNESSTVTVLNGIDLQRIEDCTNIDKKYDFLTFGWDFYRKGSDIIFEASERLKNDGYNFNILFSGNTSTWPVLKRYFNNGIPEYITLTEPVNNVSELFRRSKVFIQASRRETFSYSVCEAAYAGLPVISSDIPGLEWAKNIPLVSYFKSQSVNELYLSMKKHLDNESKINEEIVEISREIIKRNYSLETWTTNILNLYNL